MEGWCCFVFWRGNLRATLAGKPQLFGAGLVIYDRLTVSGSFSNTSLASSLEHLSSTHSLSKCPCFVSSKTWFALLCLLRNWFASWGDNETTNKNASPPYLFINLYENEEAKQQRISVFCLIKTRQTSVAKQPWLKAPLITEACIISNHNINVKGELAS